MPDKAHTQGDVLPPCCFDAHTRMECETDCGNCNVCRLTARIAELEAAAVRDHARIAGLELALQDRDSIYQHAGELEIRLNAANNEIAKLRGAPSTAEPEASQTSQQPDAYIAVKRYHSPNADGPEWEERAKVFPAGDEWAVEREEFAAEGGWEFLPIVADGDGTRFAATSPTPPLGYIAMAREKNADGPFGILPARNLATDKLSAEMQRERFAKDEDMHVIVAELREVRDA